MGTSCLYSAEVHVTCILLKRTCYWRNITKLIFIQHQIIWFSKVWISIAYTRQKWTRRGGVSEADPGPAHKARLPIEIFYCFFCKFGLNNTHITCIVYNMYFILNTLNTKRKGMFDGASKQSRDPNNTSVSAQRPPSEIPRSAKAGEARTVRKIPPLK